MNTSKGVIYEIIPELVSVQADVDIRDFLLCENFSKSKRLDFPLKFHYILKRLESENFVVPSDGYLGINGNYTVTEDYVFYERLLFFGTGFRFKYDYRKRIFYFSKLYDFLLVNIGDIFTVGRHLFHIIQLDMLLNGLFLTLSACFRLEGKTYLILAPGKNGKTSMIYNVAFSQGQYVSENFTVLDIKSDVGYGTYPIFRNKGRKSNKYLEKLLNKKMEEVVLSKTVIDSYVYINRSAKFLSQRHEKDVLFDYCFATSFNLYKNNFILSYVHYVIGFDFLERGRAELVSALQSKKFRFFVNNGSRETIDLIKQEQ